MGHFSNPAIRILDGTRLPSMEHRYMITNHPVLRLIVWLTLVGANVMLWLFFYLYFIDGAPPAVFNNVPFPVNKAIYEPGEDIVLTLDYCKDKQYEVVIYPSFVDGVVFYLPPINTTGFSTGCGLTTYRIPVPDKIPDGSYHIAGVNVYEVNVLRNRSVPWKTEQFEIKRNSNDMPCHGSGSIVCPHGNQHRIN